MDWLQKFSDSVKDFASGLTVGVTSEVLPTKIEHTGDVYIQQRQEGIELERTKLSWIQSQENIEIQQQLQESQPQANQRLNQLVVDRNSEIQEKYYQHKEQLEIFLAQMQIALKNKDINFQQWKLEQEKNLQLHITHLKQELVREIAQYNRETALSTIREQRKLVNSPITLVSDDLLESPYGDSRMPLRIFLSPPELNYDSFGNTSLGFKIETHLAEELRQFLEQNYPFSSQTHPTELLDGAWVSKKFSGGSGILALYSQLKAVPTIVLESEVDAHYLNFRVAYWRGDGSERQYKSILSGFPYRNFLYESAKQRARKWKEVRKKLLAKGKTAEQLQAIGGDNETNFYILQEEEELLSEGINIDEFNFSKSYMINDQDFQQLHQYLITFHCITVSLIADIHYLHDNNVTPLLPNLLPDLLMDISESKSMQKTILDWLIVTYNQMYKNLSELIGSWIPELMMQFAVALSNLEDKYYAKQQAQESVRAWLKLHNMDNYSFQSLNSVVTKEDQPYFNSLQDFLENMGDSKDLVQFQTLLDDWQMLNLSGNIREIPTVEPVIHFKPNYQEQQFSFEVVTVDSSGNIINRETKSNHQRIFELEDDVKLHMVYVPAGRFLMGAEAGEKDSRDYEKPLHEVNLKGFWMAKYPITQAQYLAIVGKNPSDFLGENHPVERISYNKAFRFCRRLSKKLERDFKLPSEAQWEYACRAGTTTPFSFGETITSDLANYNANKTYAQESRGKYRQKTTPVGSFYPNSWGLYDLHGNVWEWCADNWYDNYSDTDDSDRPRLDETSKWHVIRGGSWNYDPHFCRSAYRNRNTAKYIYNAFGFRCIMEE